MKKYSSREKMGEAALEMIAARFRVLGEASRLKLMIALENGEKDVSTLVAITGQTQANTSRHLSALVNAGLLNRRKEGLRVLYSISDHSIFEMCEQVCGSLQRRFDEQSDAFRPTSFAAKS